MELAYPLLENSKQRTECLRLPHWLLDLHLFSNYLFVLLDSKGGIELISLLVNNIKVMT